MPRTRLTLKMVRGIIFSLIKRGCLKGARRPCENFFIIKKGDYYEKDEKGVSCAIAFTEKGRDILEQTNAELTEHPFETAAEGQMKRSPKTFMLSINYFILKEIFFPLAMKMNIIFLFIRIGRKLRRCILQTKE